MAFTYIYEIRVSQASKFSTRSDIENFQILQFYAEILVYLSNNLKTEGNSVFAEKSEMFAVGIDGHTICYWFRDN